MWECDFTGECDGFLRSSENGEYDWKRNRGSTPSGGTGPSGDHTTGTGENTQCSIKEQIC